MLPTRSRTITLPQLAAVLGGAPTITRWGQLGLTGEWADRPIRVDAPPRITPNAMSMQTMVAARRRLERQLREASVADTAKAIAADPCSARLRRLRGRRTRLKALAVARDRSTPAIEASGETVSSGRYPLTRYMYIRLQRPARSGAFARRSRNSCATSSVARARSRSAYSGYFPLTAQEVDEELAKLD